MKGPKPVRISWLVKTGKLSPMSPTVLISEKLGIKWLMMFDGEYVYGPTPGIVELADLLMAQLRPKTVFDLFGGSGALSKLALERNAENVIYVDLHPEAAILNLKGHKRVNIIKQDALSFLEKNCGSCDLLFADPPEELIDKVLSKTTRMRKIIRKAGLIWIGPSDAVARRRIKGVGMRGKTAFINVWGDTFMVIWKSGLGKKILKVKKMIE